ncbi:hypothetical protein [Pandoraea sp.]|uniref:hypothetical protein n=1 Tax=Pandoraea sp. TaxID=1883445 RepID=UPI00121EDD1C|nr:hypothetical protein [Pandoraea sp.]TAL52802.1 MAG: hypothetical protein EPN80_17270 [Pandoraea sp.]TAM19753.1 MAG: hypothetical protein EPN65_03215 [Pandoraea sp.]
MPDALSKSFAVVVHHYRSPRDYAVSVERTGEMLLKNIGLFTDGFAGEARLLMGLFATEAQAWALANQLKRSRTMLHALLQTPKHPTRPERLTSTD